MKFLVGNFAPGIVTQLRNYAKLMRLDKPVGIWLLLWPTLWALWLAGEGHPDPGLFVVFLLGVFVMRSAGCVLNDYVDRKIDPYVERTRTRPIASGAVLAHGSADIVRRARFDRRRSGNHAEPSRAAARRGRCRADDRVPVFQSASFRYRSSFSAPPSAGPHRWRLPHTPAERRSWHGSCSARRSSGPSFTTRFTRWSIAKTTARSASSRPRCCSATWTCS